MYNNLLYGKYNLNVYVHLKFCMHEHFDLIINLFKYKYETCQDFIRSFKKTLINKMQLMNNGFTRRKIGIFDWFLQLKFSHKRHLPQKSH